MHAIHDCIDVLPRCTNYCSHQIMNHDAGKQSSAPCIHNLSHEESIICQPSHLRLARGIHNLSTLASEVPLQAPLSSCSSSPHSNKLFVNFSFWHRLARRLRLKPLRPLQQEPNANSSLLLRAGAATAASGVYAYVYVFEQVLF